MHTILNDRAPPWHELGIVPSPFSPPSYSATLFGMPFLLSSLRQLMFAVAVTVALSTLDVCAASSPQREALRGGKFEWARLQTTGTYWNRHADGDVNVLKYLQAKTPLNIDGAFHPVTATKLEDLSRYPFIYSDNITYLSAEERKNLAEYLRRGGFLFIDACRNANINPSIQVFLKAQLAVLAAQFPDLQAQEALPTHEVFSIYFKMTEFPPAHKIDPPRPGFPLQLVYAGDRLIAVIGLNGFQCAWASNQENDMARSGAQMLANIYIYAMTR